MHFAHFVLVFVQLGNAWFLVWRIAWFCVDVRTYFAMDADDVEAQRRREECERKARRGEMDPRLEFAFQLLIDGTGLERHKIMDQIFAGDMVQTRWFWSGRVGANRLNAEPSDARSWTRSICCSCRTCATN